MSKYQSSLLLIVSLVISGIIMLQMSIYMFSSLAGWNMKFNLIAVCHSWLKSLGLSSLKYVLDGLVIYTLVFSLWKIGSQLFQSQRMKRRLQQYKEKKLTTEMNQKYGRGTEEIIVFSYPTPTAFTMGLITPKIILSTGLIHYLSHEELDAVIYHEMYHKDQLDPLKVCLLSLSSSILWYIPIQKWLYHQFNIIQEILADKFAIKKQETSVNISSALLKMIHIGKKEKMPFKYVSFAATSVNYRIESLLNPINGTQMQLPLKIIIKSSIIFSLICGLFIYAIA